MNTIKTMKLLGKLAELVEMSQEPTSKHLELYNWQEAHQDDLSITIQTLELGGYQVDKEIARLNKPGWYFFDFKNQKILAQALTRIEAFNHEITQTQFKKAVREVCLELLNTAIPDPIDEDDIGIIKNMLVKYSTEEILVGFDTKDDGYTKFLYLEAICRKLGTSMMEGEA